VSRLASHNFSGGPGALPDSVLHHTRDAIAGAPGTNQSILGTLYNAVVAEDVTSLVQFMDDFRAKTQR
jgi:phosphoserine aminotransferase